LFCISLFGEKMSVGAGPYVQTQPYKGVQDITVPSPVVFFDNSLFYIRWSRAGIYFLGAKNDEYAWGFSLSAQPRPYGYKPSDSEYLSGMDERRQTLEAGLAFSLMIDKHYLEVMALTDVLNRTDAYIVKSELGTEFSLGDFTFYPSFLIIYQSQKFIDYYYGVKHNEATSSRAAYMPSAGVDFALQTYISYPLYEDFSLFVNLRADKLSNQVTRSPLVEDRFIYSGLASILYTFRY
ncbi:MAG: MipA/OmpV family protein, partial [Sulfurimonadaceae bacterium]